MEESDRNWRSRWVQFFSPPRSSERPWIEREVLNGEAAKRARARGDFEGLDLPGSLGGGVGGGGGLGGGVGGLVGGLVGVG